MGLRGKVVYVVVHRCCNQRTKQSSVRCWRAVATVHKTQEHFQWSLWQYERDSSCFRSVSGSTHRMQRDKRTQVLQEGNRTSIQFALQEPTPPIESAFRTLYARTLPIICIILQAFMQPQ